MSNISFINAFYFYDLVGYMATIHRWYVEFLAWVLLDRAGGMAFSDASDMFLDIRVART